MYWQSPPFLPAGGNMVLRGAQIHRRGQVKCSLFSTQSLPHDLARLYGRMLPLTPADLGGAADPCLDALRIWTDSHGQKSFSAPRSRRRNARLPHNQLPDAEGTFYVAGHCPDRPDAVHLDRRDVGLMR